MPRELKPTPASHWEPLRVAVAALITCGDEDFVNLTRRETNFDCLGILVDCLRKEMVGFYDEPGKPRSGSVILRAAEKTLPN